MNIILKRTKIKVKKKSYNFENDDFTRVRNGNGRNKFRY